MYSRGQSVLPRSKERERDEIAAGFAGDTLAAAGPKLMCLVSLEFELLNLAGQSVSHRLRSVSIILAK